MTEAEALKLLKNFQRWRNGANIPQPYPGQVGEALNIAIKCLTKQVENTNK